MNIIQAKLWVAYYNSFCKCFVIKVLSYIYIYIADQGINLVKIFIQVKICCKVTLINIVLLLMCPSGFYGNLKYAEDYNWHTGLLLKLFYRAGIALATGLTHNLDKTTRLVQVSPAFAGQILFLLTKTDSPFTSYAKSQHSNWQDLNVQRWKLTIVQNLLLSPPVTSQSAPLKKINCISLYIIQRTNWLAKPARLPGQTHFWVLGLQLRFTGKWASCLPRTQALAGLSPAAQFLSSTTSVTDEFPRSDSSLLSQNQSCSQKA